MPDGPGRNDFINDICPIALEPISTCAFVFVHDGVQFDASILRRYIIKAPSAVNPVTRAPIDDDDIRMLNDVLRGEGPALPTGQAQLIAAETAALLDAVVDYLMGEARDVVLSHLNKWSADETAFDFYTSLANCVSLLEHIHSDLCMSSPDGPETWKFLLKMLKNEHSGSEFAEDIFTGLAQIACMAPDNSGPPRPVPPYARHSPLLMNGL
ncbi:hypothetical protein JKP88DRAFT_251710 [Tribonema minus]|uniref:U-box domain-containing protein n=1 Tax=Tribonema minus TaxID=303371 RepID=A0A836CN08_9STRA|nr:hypothetical protein JKP88DRAFT_251710 [Tribonema minus]